MKARPCTLRQVARFSNPLSVHREVRASDQFLAVQIEFTVFS